MQWGQSFPLEQITHEFQTLQTVSKMQIPWKKENKKIKGICHGWNFIISEIRLLLGILCAYITHSSRPDQSAQGRGKKPNKPEKVRKLTGIWNIIYNLSANTKISLLLKQSP